MDVGLPFSPLVLRSILDRTKCQHPLRNALLQDSSYSLRRTKTGKTTLQKAVLSLRCLHESAPKKVVSSRLSSDSLDLVVAVIEEEDGSMDVQGQIAFWVPSWASPCGVAEYTTSLVTSLRLPYTIHRDAPPLQNTRVLHIQHEDALFLHREEELLQCMQEAQQKQIPIVVTEHTVMKRRMEWEQYADVLITLTEGGADLLRSQWPDKTVLRIPHGCPTWFPPRKSKKGKVIGTFGFPYPYKRFSCFLDVLQEVKDSELLLISHAKHQELETWIPDFQNFAVKRITHFLSDREVASLLAAEADILVFWYSEYTQRRSASGAVRLGLASGVPTLTSQTSWFREVRHVTYQPADLVEGVRTLLEDESLKRSLAEAAVHYCHQHDWEKITQMHTVLWRNLYSRIAA